MSLFIGNDHRITLTGLKDEDGNLVTGATVTARLLEADAETEVSGVSWPTTLSDDGGGDYSGVLDDAASLEKGKAYYLEVKAVSGSTQAVWRQVQKAQFREFDQ